MTKKKKILLWVMVSVLTITLTLGLGIGLVSIGNSQDKLPDLSQGELMAELNGQITEMSSDELNDAIDDFQNTIDRYGYPIALVSYEINGKIEKIEVLLQGNSYTLPKLGETETQYFKGWRINGEGKYYYPDESLKVSTSVKFVADMANKAVVKLMVDGEVYDTEYVIHGDSVYLPYFSDTDTHYYNGWKNNINGQLYKGSQYIDQDVTYTLDMQEHPTVTFCAVDGTVLKTEQVRHGSYITLFTQNDTETHHFNGWKIEGEGNSYTGSYQVTQNVRFVVDMVEHPTVTYCAVDGTVLKTEHVKHNTYTTLLSIPDTETHYFAGWKLDGVGASKTGSYQITQDVSFVLDMPAKLVVTYLVGSEVYNTEYVKPGSQVNLPKINDTETSYYVGWQIDGAGEVFTGNYQVNQDVTFVVSMVESDFVAANLKQEEGFVGSYIWKDNSGNIYYSYDTDQYALNGDTWEKKTWERLTSFSGSGIWTDGEHTYYSSGYVLNGNTWEAKTWEGLTDLNSGRIWTDGEHTYYSNGSKQYVLNGDTWEVKTWEGLTNFYGSYIWTDGEHTYYSKGADQYVLNGDTWEYKDSNYFTKFNYSDLEGRYIWTDGEHTYYSYISDYYVLNGDTWKPKAWTGLAEFNGSDIWTDGEHTYCSNQYQHYILNGDTWGKKTWTGLTNFYGSSIWTDGEHTYYSSGSKHYILNGDKWEAKTWEGLTSFSGSGIWTDGEHTYYSSGSNQYVLNGDTWEAKTWEGLTNFNGSDIWTDGEHTYYSDDYVLNGDTWERKTWTGLTNFDGGDIWTDGENVYVTVDRTTYKLIK